MNRRSTLKSLGVIAAGIALLPGCSDGLNLIIEEGDAFSLSPAQGKWINAISQAILPYGDKEIMTLESFPAFVVNMVTKTYTEKENIAFIDGYNATTSALKETLDTQVEKISPLAMVEFFKNKMLEEADDTLTPKANQVTGRVNEQLTPEAKLELELELENSQEFINQVRQLSIYHLTTAQAYMETVDDYNIIPGTYQGAVVI